MFLRLLHLHIKQVGSVGFGDGVGARGQGNGDNAARHAVAAAVHLDFGAVC